MSKKYWGKPLDHWSLLMYGKTAKKLTPNQRKKIPNYIKANAWDNAHKKYLNK